MRRLPCAQYEWDRETLDEQRSSGHWIPATVIIWHGHRYVIGAGTKDEVDLFTENGALYVLSRNRGLGYAGLEVFRDGERIADVFCDGEIQGDYLNELTAVYAAKRLSDWGDC